MDKKIAKWLEGALKRMSDEELENIDTLSIVDFHKLIKEQARNILRTRENKTLDLMTQFNGKYFAKYEEGEFDDDNNYEIQIVSFRYNEATERWLMESYYMCTYNNEYVSTSAHSDDNVMEIELIDEWSEKIKRYKEISKIEYEHILSCITSQPQVFKSHLINIKNLFGLQ